MIGSLKLLLLIKLIFFEVFELMCIEDDSFRRFRRLRSSNESNLVPGTSLAGVIAVFTDDSSALVNCTTEQQVTELALDWYFEENNSQKSSRVIWQRGRAKIDRYKAFSSDQFHHYLKIKPVYLNDSGTYTCLDQATGAQKRVELVVRDSRSCAGSIIRSQITLLIYLISLSLNFSRRMSSEAEVT